MPEQEYLKPQVRRKSKIDFDLKPSTHFWIVPVILAVQIAVFVLMGLSGVDWVAPKAEDLVSWGAIFRTSIINGQYWRMFTAAFVHAGFFHLLMNGFTLLILGRILEPVIGQVKLISLFLISTLAASLVSVSWHVLKVGVGGSGAIFGLFGCLIVLLIFRSKDFGALLSQIILLVIVMSVDVLFSSFSDNIDHSAHLGGFLVGIVSGFLLIPGQRNPEKSNLSAGLLGLFGILCFISSFLVIQNLDDPFGEYLEASRLFDQRKTSLSKEIDPIYGDTLDFTELAESYRLQEIEWQGLLVGLDTLKLDQLPGSLKVRTQNMELYTKLRRRQAENLKYYYQSGNDSFYVIANQWEGQFAQLDSLIQIKKEE